MGMSGQAKMGEAARNFVGKRLEDAQAVCKAERIPCRISSRDGESYMLTMDYNPGRYNFSVEGEVVVAQRMG